MYDQIFIDGTYLNGGCLLVAATTTHPVAWHWARKETTTAYTHLIQQLTPPLCVALDGGQGAYSMIKHCWSQAMIQRCLVHAQRVVRRYAASTPRTTAGVMIYALAKQFTRIHTPDQATTWILNLHEFGQIYQEFLNEKTLLPLNRRATTKTWEYTHPRVRKTYHSLLHLARKTGFLPTSLHLLPLSILTGEKLRPTP